MEKPFCYRTQDHTLIHGTIHSDQGEPILFLHYMGGNEAIWNGVIPSFTNAYRVVTLNLRGHGKSEDPGKGYDFATLAEDIVLALDHLKIDAAHLVGSSFGCSVATAFAARFPERTLSLVNSEGAMQNDAGPGGKYTESKEEFMEGLAKGAEVNTYPSKEAFIATLKREWLPWNSIKENSLKGIDLALQSDGTYVRKPSIASWLQIKGHQFDIRLEDWYEEISCPVLFLPAAEEGGLDGKLSFIKEKIQPVLSSSKIEVIPGTTHAMMFDHDQELSAAILTFHKECVGLSMI
ncbi:alpha/beta fold hydrolase [Marininema halotolerans]|uniref:2-succinyl-6-hydroxy-2,4-cyclohexadiene-1-carboxylate synthase n=1 Tax=Marininema halotolerans TaxID=1155944 RepID=A0A1I6Q2Y6_9BACL|nr:alpha/beta hydrolase [Marininema halotolerans]SFS46827.1 2-succinyl-6-hydroxy-2,4-cyclohexadiene-1-carboxylate synthase [Marininema halotolerans]